MNVVHTSRLLLTAFALLVGTAACASEAYDAEAKKLDAALATAKMNPTPTDTARKLRAENLQMMKEGKEMEAMRLLEDVKRLLGMGK